MTNPWTPFYITLKYWHFQVLIKIRLYNTTDLNIVIRTFNRTQNSNSVEETVYESPCWKEKKIDCFQGTIWLHCFKIVLQFRVKWLSAVKAICAISQKLNTAMDLTLTLLQTQIHSTNINWAPSMFQLIRRQQKTDSCSPFPLWYNIGRADNETGN